MMEFDINRLSAQFCPRSDQIVILDSIKRPDLVQVNSLHSQYSLQQRNHNRSHQSHDTIHFLRIVRTGHRNNCDNLLQLLHSHRN